MFNNVDFFFLGVKQFSDKLIYGSTFQVILSVLVVAWGLRLGFFLLMRYVKQLAIDNSSILHFILMVILFMLLNISIRDKNLFCSSFHSVPSNSISFSPLRILSFNMFFNLRRNVLFQLIINSTGHFCEREWKSSTISSSILIIFIGARWGII